jgi:CrcB protein
VDKFLIVVGTGGIGSGARYLVGLATGDRAFPYATMIVNVVGSFLIALVLELALKAKTMSPNMTLGLTTGFMGGFTTYSSFNYQTTALWMTGQHAKAAVNIVVTVVACLAAGIIGIWLARRLA